MESVKNKEDCIDTPTELLYKKFYDSYKKFNLHIETNGKILQKKINKSWREARDKYKKFDELEKNINHMISEMNMKYLQSKASNICRLFKPVRIKIIEAPLLF